MNDALGMVETRGLATAITVADVMVKTANVKLIGAERARGHGWTTIKVMGDVAAVNAAVSAGKKKAEEYGHFVSSKVIPRPVDAVKELFCTRQKQEEDAEEKPAPAAEPESGEKPVSVRRTARKTEKRAPVKKEPQMPVVSAKSETATPAVPVKKDESKPSILAGTVKEDSKKNN